MQECDLERGLPWVYSALSAICPLSGYLEPQGQAVLVLREWAVKRL